MSMHCAAPVRIAMAALFLLLASVSCCGYAEARNAGQATASFLRFDLASAEQQADAAIKAHPSDAAVWFVRMEVAELNGHPGLVLDSALRLCRMSAPPAMQEIASARVLRYAGNTSAFNAVAHRIQAQAQRSGICSLNLALALIASAADGSAVNLDDTARAAGMLTHWSIAGPFGHTSNSGFDRRWQPEADHLSQSSYGSVKTEEFQFRDGLISLPDYLSAPGVFYAASSIDLRHAGAFTLDVAGAGPYIVFVDGKPALTHDSRFTLAAGRDSAPLQLAAGKHRLLLKFTSDAAPLRVALFPSVSRPSDGGIAVPAGLEGYVEGMRAYLRDDLPALERAMHQPSGRLNQYLRALLYSQVEGHEQEERSAWQALLPSLLARWKIASLNSGANTTSDATAEIPLHPDWDAAFLLRFQSYHEEPVLRQLLALHSSCANLNQAIPFYDSMGQPEQARKLQSRLGSCAPGSLDYARSLSTSGDHAQAATSLRQLLAANPLDRAARRMLVAELVLDHQEGEARQQAEMLHRIAPNSRSFARLAAAPDEVLDSRSGRAAGFVQRSEFYEPYRRDGLQLVRDTRERIFSGGPSVTLLLDKIVEYSSDGSLSIYTHRITRVLNKDGIMQLGEVALPRGGDLLELRTIQSSGAIIEPELAPQKPTVSMPALEPGDNIEEEFVEHFSAVSPNSQNSFRFTFGSFSAPVLYSRLMVVNPEKDQLEILESNAPAARTQQLGDSKVRIWEQNNIAQTAAENFLPPGDLLPYVTISPRENTAEPLRDQLIEQTRAGLRVIQTASRYSAEGEQDRARNLYRFVTSKIQSSGEWADTSAEDTLQNLDGSRTATLLALARSAGLKSALLLARKMGSSCAGKADLSCYAQPLVRFFFLSGQVVDVDAETAALPFGAIPPVLDREDAVLIPLPANAAESSDEGRPLHVALSLRPIQEKSTAEGNLALQSDGSLAARLLVRLGAARGQQVRAALHAANVADRQLFFEQLALLIFPGATHVTGSAAHEDDPEQPLELTLECSIPQLVNPQNRNFDLDQLVPALGLRALYVRSAARKFPLYIDSAFFENTTFHLRLPPQFKVSALPPDFTAHGEFGGYSVRFHATGQEISVQRDFHIPAQIVPPEKYQAFATFARQIDEAERRRISLTR